MTRIQLALPILAVLLASTSTAQTPIQPSADLNSSLNERLQEGAERARWLWGTLRVQPTLGLRDVRLVDDVEIDSDAAIGGAPTNSDITVGLFAGLHFYQLIGENSAAAFFLRPQYDHWVDLEDRSRLNLNFGAALAVSTNRFFVDLEGIRNEGQGIVTNEAEQIINSRRDLMEIRLGVPIYRSLALVGAFQRTETENLLDESPSETVPNFGLLDETVDSFAAGIQVEPGRVTKLFVGFRELEGEAANSLRNYEAEGPTATLEISAGTLNLKAIVDRLEWTPTGPMSTFEPIDATTGRLDLILNGLGPHSLGASFQRSLNPSVRAVFNDFEATTSQFRWSFQATDRVQTQVGYELVDRDYRGLGIRGDEQELWRAAVTYGIGKLRLTVQYDRSEIDSTVDQFDRDTQRLGLSFSFALPGLSWPSP